MSADDERPFFVGYLPVPAALRGFLALVGLAVLVLFAGAGWLIGATQDDPGPGAFRFDFGRQTVTGVLTLSPYPVLHVTEGSERVPPGRSLLLSAGGKRGLMGRAEPLAGRMATASGVILKRGELDMLQVRGGAAGLAAAAGEGAPPVPVPLGRWRLAGEICDGKCLAGAMRPGTGLAHKACANLCLIGGLPPVFVSSAPVEGAEFLLMAGPDGGPLPAAAYDYVGLLVAVEGDIERRGDLLVFRVDLNSVEAL